MIRAILGLLKGLIVGGGIGYGLFRLHLDGLSVFTYLGCVLAGALAGVVCGRAPWRSDTIWTPVVKAISGGVVGAILAALGLHFLPDVTLLDVPQLKLATHGGTLLATVVGVAWGIFVEIDDGGTADDEKAAAARKAAAPNGK